LASANTWTANNAFNSTATSGSALSATRNLAAASTDSPVVSVVQDNASDDQPALRVQQDGSGDIIQAYDGGTKVFHVADGGDTTISGDLKVGDGATGIIRIDGAAGTLRATIYQTAGSNRWYAGADNDAESGSNQGSSYILRSRTDAGGLLRTDLKINRATGAWTVPGVITVGAVTSPGATRVAIQAGTSTNDAAVGGVLVKDFTSYGNVGTGEDNLVSFSVIANTLSANNMSLTITALGAAFNSASTKVVRMKWGGTTISTLTIASGADYAWKFEGELYRLGTSNGIVIGQWMTNTGSAAAAIYPFTQVFSSLAFSSARTILFTGQITSGSNDDVTSDYFRVDWADANT
jgi:hypothetical protein